MQFLDPRFACDVSSKSDMVVAWTAECSFRMPPAGSFCVVLLRLRTSSTLSGLVYEDESEGCFSLVSYLEPLVPKPSDCHNLAAEHRQQLTSLYRADWCVDTRITGTLKTTFACYVSSSFPSLAKAVVSLFASGSSSFKQLMMVGLTVKVTSDVSGLCKHLWVESGIFLW